MSSRFGQLDDDNGIDFSVGGDSLADEQPATFRTPSGSLPAAPPRTSTTPTPSRGFGRPRSLGAPPVFEHPTPTPKAASAPAPAASTPAQPALQPQYDEPAYQEPAQQYQAAPAQQAYPEPVQQQAPAYAQPSGIQQVQPEQPQGVERVIVKVDHKGREIKEKPPKPGKEKKEKSNAFRGSRRNVLIARVALIAVIAILSLLGVRSLLPASSGLTAADGPVIIDNVRYDLGVTDFPATAGGSMAVAFTQAYLSYNPDDRAARETQLLQFAPESVVSQFSVRPASEEELNSINTGVVIPPTQTEEEGTEDTGDAVVGTQVVTDGPYLVRSVMVRGGENAIFTVMAEVNDERWVYLEVPMLYVPDTGSLAVSGSPSFTSATSVAEVPASTYVPEWTEDGDLADLIQEDMIAYMRAWGASDTTTLSRLTVTVNGENLSSDVAQSGLGQSVTLVRVSDLAVESKPNPGEDASAEETEDYNTRDARIEVVWMENGSQLVVTQTYELELQYVNNDWFVLDIQNIATSVDETRERR